MKIGNKEYEELNLSVTIKPAPIPDGITEVTYDKDGNSTLVVLPHDEWYAKHKSNVAESIIKKHTEELAKKQEELILGIFKKQKGFVGLEESKDKIQVNRMMNRGEYVGTDYIFDGKVILTIFPFKLNEENGKFTATFDYLEHG